MTSTQPHIHPEARIAQSAVVVGDISLGARSTVLFNAVLRGDCGGRITIGEETNLQENVCVHVNAGGHTRIGSRCTVGHGAIVHGCTIGNGTMVGMGAIVLDNAVVGNRCLVGAGALVTGTARIPDGMLVIGSPARAVRALDDGELAALASAAEEYLHVGENLEAEGYLRKASSLHG